MIIMFINFYLILMIDRNNRKIKYQFIFCLTIYDNFQKLLYYIFHFFSLINNSNLYNKMGNC
jgi:hypothetical protein